ncbi:MAG: YfhO family protein [Chitinophagaceae bacterium]|nr:YfhO family protein [Chitinophagaceae bacterium]
MAQLVLPASFVSKISPKMVNKTIHSSPPGFPVTDLKKSLAENSTDAFSNFNISGLKYFYNKRIGISKVTNSPAFLVQQDKFLQTEKLFNMVSSLPVAYLASPVLTLKDTASLQVAIDSCRYAFTASSVSTDTCTQNDKVQIKRLSANNFVIETESKASTFLVLSQNYYHHWKVKIDDKPGVIYNTNISFMGTPIPPGRHTIVFQFVPTNTIRAMWIQLIVLIILLATGLFHINKRKNS